MKGTPLIDTKNPELVLRAYALGLKIVANVPHVLTLKDLEHWEANLGGLKDALTRGFSTGEVPASVSVGQPPAFVLLTSFELVVPAGYKHGGYLGRFHKANRKKFYGYNDDIIDENFGNPSRVIKAGERFLIKLIGITCQVSSEECLAVYEREQAHLVGAQGLALLWEHKRKELPVGKWTLSFDKKECLPVVDGYHRVPRVRRHSDAVFRFGLGDFECPWNDYDVLALFCDLPRA